LIHIVIPSRFQKYCYQIDRSSRNTFQARSQIWFIVIPSRRFSKVLLPDRSIQ
jgi:hypothetical protein